MSPTLIGYLAKRVVKRLPGASSSAPAPFPVGPPVEEICSVSDCLAKGAEGRGELAPRNPFGLYDSPELAWSQVPAEAKEHFDLFAYRLYPVQYVDGRQETLDKLTWWDLAVEPMPGSFLRLGWDAVEGGNQLAFGCSPLSCNGQAGLPGLPAVNRFCLVTAEQSGFDLAREFSISKPEPGPYCVVEVWRKGRGGVS